MYFLLSEHFEFGGESAGLLYGTREEKGFQSFSWWQMVEGVTGWRKSHFQHVHLFLGRQNRKWWSSQERKKKCNSNAQAELWRLPDNKHCTDSSDFSPLFVFPELISCLSICQSKPDCRTWLHFWHTLSQMILIMSDILSEPLLSPLGKAPPHWPSHTLAECQIKYTSRQVH